MAFKKKKNNLSQICLFLCNIVKLVRSVLTFTHFSHSEKHFKEFNGIFHQNKGNKGIFKLFVKIKEFKRNSFKINPKERYDA